MECGVVHEKLDELGHHDTAVFIPMDKGVTSIAASPARIAPCTTASYALFYQVGGLVRLLVVEEHWIVDCNLGFMSSLPREPVTKFFCSMPLSRRH